MITTVKEAKEIAKQWNALKKDSDRIKFVHENKSKVKVILDNDGTWISLIHDMDTEEETDVLNDISLNSFDDYFGNGPGIDNLLEYLGIVCEGC